MKKSIIKLTVFCLVFLLAAVIVNKIMNRGHDNLTMEMAPASLPLVTLVMDGREYNQLHGYTADMDVAFQRDTVTVLGEGRDTGFAVDTFGTRVTGISIEVRSADGSRLIEDTEITDYETAGNRINGRLALKDLIEKDTEYSLRILLELEGGDRPPTIPESSGATAFMWRRRWTSAGISTRGSMTKRPPGS